MLGKSFRLILAAAAAYGLYKYSKLSTQEKNNLKAKGKDFVDKNLSGLNGLLGKNRTAANG
jgi:hypothetical protein